MNKRLLILWLLLTPLGHWAQTTAEPEPIIPIDETVIETRSFDDDLSKKYSGNEFDYDQIRGESQNLLRQFIDWFFRTLEDLFGIEIDPELYSLMETLLYIVLIGIGLYFMVRLLMGQQATSFFKGKSKALAPLAIQEEQLQQTDFDAFIKEAKAQGDYRLAIRYQYLKVLRALSQGNLIDWHFEKTNSDYMREINSAEVKEGFGKVSYLYDYIWYGEFGINEGEYQKADRSFESLLKSIRKHG